MFRFILSIPDPQSDLCKFTQRLSAQNTSLSPLLKASRQFKQERSPFVWFEVHVSQPSALGSNSESSHISHISLSGTTRKAFSSQDLLVASAGVQKIRKDPFLDR